MDRDTELIPVPLPTEIPEPPNIDQLPLDILHSATVEMLLQQNDDLSSRLKVNIRRNSQQEQKILDLKKQVDHLERANENLQAQNEIVKEKEGIWTRQKKDQNRKVESTNKEMELLQLRYNELYTTSQQRQKELFQQVVEKNNIIDSLQRKLTVLNKVRARAKDKLRNFLMSAAQSIHQGQSETHKVASKNRLLKKHFEELSQQIKVQENQFRVQLDEIKKISEKKISELEQRNTLLNEDLQFKDEKHREIKEELHQLDLALIDEKKNRERLAKTSKELGEIKNERLTEKRKYLEIIKQLEQNRNLNAEKQEILQDKAQQSLRELTEAKSALKLCEQELLDIRKDNADLEAQLDKLQNLWMETQSDLEKEQIKRLALEKINKELSRDKKSERVKKSIERAHSEENNTKKSKTQLSDIYASQYGPINNDQPSL